MKKNKYLALIVVVFNLLSPVFSLAQQTHDHGSSAGSAARGVAPQPGQPAALARCHRLPAGILRRPVVRPGSRRGSCCFPSMT